MSALVLCTQAEWRLKSTISELWDHSERYRLAYMHLNGHELDEALGSQRFRTSQHEVIPEAALEAALTGESTLCSHRLVRHLQRTLEGVDQEASLAHQPTLSHHVLTDLHGQET